MILSKNYVATYIDFLKRNYIYFHIGYTFKSEDYLDSLIILSLIRQILE